MNEESIAMQRARKEFGPAREAISESIPESDIWTADELARYYRCTKQHIINQAAAGKIQGAFRVGRLWRFHRKKLLSAG